MNHSRRNPVDVWDHRLNLSLSLKVLRENMTLIRETGSMADFGIFMTLCTEWNYGGPKSTEVQSELRIIKKPIPQLEKLATGWAKVNARVFDGAFENRTLIFQEFGRGK
ncbi:hypothetical protein NLJ89_g3681 [Agrocybe chaxingu]|uniref:Uncharacterized protein n=1 Tax=Agrocybe chaxingu TaxID=84603 RepID=A0A9W8K498_9AGAR|nr:hypothetical protein NLJ89_g3681 [Agrocybe chaxingu]